MIRHRTAVRWLLLAVGVAACGDPSGGERDPVPPGLWVATAGPGMTLSFLVDPVGTAITRVDVDWTDWVCGAAAPRTGGTASANDGGWPIRSREFDFSFAAGIGQSMHLEGTFAADDSTAAGAWSATMTSGSCSGAWSAHQ